MKKKIFSMMLVTVMLLLAACSSMQPKEFGKLFVDRVIYDKKSEKLTKNIADSKGFEDALESSSKQFKAGFKSSVTAQGFEVKDEQIDKIYQTLIKRMKAETSYEIKEAEQKGKEMKIVYSIKGLDFAAVMKEYLKACFEAGMNNPSLANDKEGMMTVIMDEYEKAINNGKVKKEAVDITLNFKKEKNKWTMSTVEQRKISNLYIAFYFGEKDQFAFRKTMNEVTQETLKDMQ